MEFRFGFTKIDLETRLRVFKPETPIRLAAFRIVDAVITCVAEKDIEIESKNAFDPEHKENHRVLSLGWDKADENSKGVIKTVGELLQVLEQINHNYYVVIETKETASNGEMYIPKYVGIGIWQGEYETPFAVICKDISELDIRESFKEEKEDE